MTHVSRSGYVLLNLPARRSADRGRASGGSLVCVKKRWSLSSVSKDYFDWGEEISFCI